MSTEDAGALIGYLEHQGLSPEERGDGIRVEVEDGAGFIPCLAREFEGDIEGIELRRPTLDDVFLKLTGRTIRESELGQEDVARSRMKNRMRFRDRR